ncbi:MAG: DegV family protein [Oscillospiraceae bacterium]|nr:DegV family protein [Oscillospiraceae bacterium]MBQ8239171.1 DegV family protein [Oscillospiraceae bacterium]
MENFKIVTDSCCDFTDEMYSQYDVACAPLSVLYKGVLHDNFSDDARMKALYDGIRGGEMPTTSAVNPEGWANVMKPALEAGRDVLAICFSSGLSTTYQSAVIAADELKEFYPDRKVIVIDSLCAALGQGLLVWHACAKRDAGESLEDVAAWVEANKLNVCHWVTVDDLFHLKRGGRVSATTALVGSMLNIKPIIKVDEDGKLQSVAKARGRKAAMDTLARKVGEATDKDTVFIAHGDCLEDAQALAATIRERYGVRNVHIGYVGAVIGAHTGPGVLVVFYMGQKR